MSENTRKRLHGAYEDDCQRPAINPRLIVIADGLDTFSQESRHDR